MKSLMLIIMLNALSGCVSSEWFPKGYGHELAYKCQINPYDPECLQPRPIFKNS